MPNAGGTGAVVMSVMSPPPTSAVALMPTSEDLSAEPAGGAPPGPSPAASVGALTIASMASPLRNGPLRAGVPAADGTQTAPRTDGKSDHARGVPADESHAAHDALAAANHRAGLFYGLAAYGLWGIVPFYFKLVATVPPLEILAHRIVWSTALLAVLITIAGRWGEFFAVWRSGRTLGKLVLSMSLIGANWLVFLDAVTNQQVMQTSLGYFMSPLLSILTGVLVFGEGMTRWRAAALVLAGVGVALPAAGTAGFPWVAVALAVSFSGYGAVRKTVPVDGLLGLAVETTLLLPAMLIVVAARETAGVGAITTGGTGMLVLLAFSGVTTTVPLICFGQAARKLPLATLGFLQYISPSLTFVLAAVIFGEPLDGMKLASFGLIWAALLVYTVETVRRLRAG